MWAVEVSQLWSLDVDQQSVGLQCVVRHSRSLKGGVCCTQGGSVDPSASQLLEADACLDGCATPDGGCVRV